MRIAVLVLCLLLPWSAEALQFFCPRADLEVSLQRGGDADAKEEIKLQSSPGLALSYPKTVADLESAGGDLNELSITLGDCSSAQFFCKAASHRYGTGVPVQYFLVVPRIIKPGKELDYKGVHMVTRLAATTTGSHDATAQVTTWQNIDGKQIPFEFTVQANRGLLYWDGFIFDFSDNRPAETCVFDEVDPLFASVKVRLR